MGAETAKYVVGESVFPERMSSEHRSGHASRLMILVERLEVTGSENCLLPPFWLEEEHCATSFLLNDVKESANTFCWVHHARRSTTMPQRQSFVL